MYPWIGIYSYLHHNLRKVIFNAEVEKYVDVCTVLCAHFTLLTFSINRLVVMKPNVFEEDGM